MVIFDNAHYKGKTRTKKRILLPPKKLNSMGSLKDRFQISVIILSEFKRIN